ncbi:MAG TPA: UDP-N-acetylmuramoyl-L-alanine--D-glutamate ligase [Acidimicrobiales bacterium]|nr:UDP-N-acetylmuramoyl-L-alanine--D-glutamate ligase [Acidimicrobiales bacterium]
MGERVLVVGLGVTGRAVCRLLGGEAVVLDDHLDAAKEEAAAELGVELVDEVRLEGVSMVVPSPGVPVSHPVFAAAEAAGVPVVSEIELAWQRASMPLVAVTGTNGKTTVTTMVAEMLHTVAAGNIGLPLVEAVTQDVPVVVAEVSSFQLQHTDGFRPRVAVWLNVAEDHLDWHPTMEHYAAAKARVWANQRDDDVAVGNADDAVVRAALARAPARTLTFGSDGDWRVDDGALVGPPGEVARLEELPRSLPHDVANALAACAAATEAGASVDDCRAVLLSFRGLPHRVQPVGDAGGVRFYDDSKATTPASVLAALQGFPSVVLIAGGRNKGLDLSVLRREAPRLRAVVAIGDAAGEVVAAFEGAAPTQVAASMDEAVRLAREAARPGDAVLLSPGCASFDWYRNYAERGDDFRRAVTEQVGP